MSEFHSQFIFTVEMIGTIAFALSGAATAIRKGLDLFGIIMLGTITAVGGGIIRDVIIGKIPPNTFINPVYIGAAIITSGILFLILYTRPELKKSRLMSVYERMLNLSDAIGLAAFTVLGSEAGIDAGYGNYSFLIVFLGVSTGIGGGMLRDIMAGEIPYVLKKEIYACASLAGSVIYLLLLHFKISNDIAMLVGAIFIIAIRIIASRFNWNLPIVRHHKQS